MAEQFHYNSVLAPYMNQLIRIKNSAGISALRTKWILKEFDDYASAYRLTDPHISEEFITEWRKTRKADCDRTLYAKYSVWSQLTTLMCRRGCSCFIPCLPKQPKPNFAPTIFTDEQIKAIFDAADKYRLYDIRMGTALISMPALLRLMYATGMRVSEALSIRNSDVHLDEHYILLRKTKNGSERISPLGDEMTKVLAEYISYRNAMPLAHVAEDSGLLFVKSDGTGISPNAVYQHFKKLLVECGIPHKGNHMGPRVHDQRHTYAVHALVQMSRMGMDLYASLPILSANLGHHSLSATEQYVHLTCAMYPELEEQCSPINVFVYPQICKAYDYDN
ncbi:tyrosine-type recombinase/integrase [Proteiniphilum propionicum]|jgi:site-specific recombinase XerD|nr:tyrosine-type recombinase/integrase [Proteiniphilum propionicum]